MAAKVSANTAQSSGRTLGTLYTAIDQLRDEAVALFGAYENDEDVASLADRASSIGSLGHRIAGAFGEIEQGLNQL